MNESLTSPIKSDCIKIHKLEYSIYTNTITWCSICKKNFYNKGTNSHTIIINN
jgi:hypothetical protein